MREMFRRRIRVRDGISLAAAQSFDRVCFKLGRERDVKKYPTGNRVASRLCFETSVQWDPELVCPITAGDLCPGCLQAPSLGPCG